MKKTRLIISLGATTLAAAMLTGCWDSGSNGSMIGVASNTGGAGTIVTVVTTPKSDSSLDLHLDGTSEFKENASTGAWKQGESVHVTASVPQGFTINNSGQTTSFTLIADKNCQFSTRAPYIWTPANCGAIVSVSSTPAIKANNAISPVKVSFKASSKQKNNIKATAPLLLSASNSYQAKAKLDVAQYAMDVTPKLDSRDYVATYPATFKPGTSSIAINYTASAKILATAVPYKIFNANNLQAAHYNTAYITGLSFKSGKFMADNKTVNLTALPAGFTAFIKLQPADLNLPGLVQALPKSYGVVVDFSKHQDAASLSNISNLHTQSAATPLAFILPSKVSSNFATQLSDMLTKLQSSKSWNGFVDLPISALATDVAPEYLTGLSTKHVLASDFTATATTAQLASDYTASEQKMTGLMIQANSKIDTSALANKVFLDTNNTSN